MFCIAVRMHNSSVELGFEFLDLFVQEPSHRVAFAHGEPMGGCHPRFFFVFNNVRAKLWSVFTHILSYYIYTYIISSDLTNATCIIVISPTYMCRWNPSIPRWLKHTSGAYPRSLQHPELRKDSELINHLQGAVVYARCWLLLECSSKNANSPMFWPK